jgi:hypothetical protein
MQGAHCRHTIEPANREATPQSHLRAQFLRPGLSFYRQLRLVECGGDAGEIGENDSGAALDAHRPVSRADGLPGSSITVFSYGGSPNWTAPPARTLRAWHLFASRRYLTTARPRARPALPRARVCVLPPRLSESFRRETSSSYGVSPSFLPRRRRGTKSAGCAVPT